MSVNVFISEAAAKTLSEPPDGVVLLLDELP
jgi:hypothetical protein